MSGKDQPVEGDRMSAPLDPRSFEGEVADPLKVTKPVQEAKPKKARTREGKKRSI